MEGQASVIEPEFFIFVGNGQTRYAMAPTQFAVLKFLIFFDGGLDPTILFIFLLVEKIKLYSFSITGRGPPWL